MCAGDFLGWLRSTSFVAQITNTLGSVSRDQRVSLVKKKKTVGSDVSGEAGEEA